MKIRMKKKEVLKVLLVAIFFIFTSCTNQSNVNEKLINIIRGQSPASDDLYDVSGKSSNSLGSQILGRV